MALPPSYSFSPARSVKGFFGEQGLTIPELSTLAPANNIGSAFSSAQLNTALIGVDQVAVSLTLSAVPGSGFQTVTATAGFANIPTPRPSNTSNPLVSAAVSAQPFTLPLGVQGLFSLQLAGIALPTSLTLGGVSLSPIAVDTAGKTYPSALLGNGTPFINFQASVSLTTYNPTAGAVSGTATVSVVGVLYAVLPVL